MADKSTKRSLPPKVAAMKARKRQRMENPASSKTVEEKPQRPGKKVRLDELTWKEVSLPDRFDDAEGFFGLEEIDDVAVVKDESTGRVTYQAVGKRAKGLPAPKPDAITADGDSEAEYEGDEEFTGFVDGLVETVVPNPAPEDEEYTQSPPKGSAEKAPKEKKEKNKKKDKKKDAKQAKSTSNDAAASAFATLAENDEDEGVDISKWRSLGLSDDILGSLSKLKFGKPTPIQKAAITEILAGHDVIGKASTGSGKTLAFGIPIVERFLELKAQNPRSEEDEVSEENRRPPLALILSPTRELAHQLAAHITALCSNLPGRGPSVTTVTGGLSLLKQQRLLKYADIIVGTPGRLWEVISEGQGLLATLKKIQFLVVDEADRLLSQGHFKEVEEILNALDRQDQAADDEEMEEADAVADTSNGQAQRQTLVFSATFHRGLQQKLAGKGKANTNLLDKKESMEYLISKLNFREEKPKFVDVNPISQMAAGLKEGLVECAGTEKDLYLYALLLLHSNQRALVFTNSIAAVRRLVPFLQNLQLPVLGLHSQMAQKARLRSVERFTGTKEQQANGNTPNGGSILVATDVAARGLDIKNVQLVIHYHLPRAADTYVHRSGRTARAGEKGQSILICGPEEVTGVRRLIAKVHANAATTEDTTQAAKDGYYIRSLDIDRRVVSRLKPRATLAKQLADTQTAKEKKNHEDNFLREAAEELGVEYDSEEFEKQATGKRGRGSGRLKKEREARHLSKDEVAGLRGQLKDMLRQRINVGVSERYPTAGGIDIDEILRQGEGKAGDFLGTVRGIGMEDDL